MNIVALGMRIIIIITGLWKIYAMLKVNSFFNLGRFDVKVRIPLEVIFTAVLVVSLTYVDQLSLFRNLFSGDINGIVFLVMFLLLSWIIYTLTSIYEVAYHLKSLEESKYIGNTCNPETALMMTFFAVLPGIIYVTVHLSRVKY